MDPMQQSAKTLQRRFSLWVEEEKRGRKATGSGEDQEVVIITCGTRRKGRNPRADQDGHPGERFRVGTKKVMRGRCNYQSDNLGVQRLKFPGDPSSVYNN